MTDGDASEEDRSVAQGARIDAAPDLVETAAGDRGAGIPPRESVPGKGRDFPDEPLAPLELLGREIGVDPTSDSAGHLVGERVPMYATLRHLHAGVSVRDVEGVLAELVHREQDRPTQPPPITRCLGGVDEHPQRSRVLIDDRDLIRLPSHTPEPGTVTRARVLAVIADWIGKVLKGWKRHGSPPIDGSLPSSRP